MLFLLNYFHQVLTNLTVNFPLILYNKLNNDYNYNLICNTFLLVLYLKQIQTYLQLYNY